MKIFIRIVAITFIVLSLLMIFVSVRELTSPQATKVDIGITATPSTTPSTATGGGGATATNTLIANSPAENEEVPEAVIVVRVEGTSTPGPAAEGTSDELSAYLNDGKATLKLVLTNDGDVEFNPGFEIPAVFNANGDLVSIDSIDVTPIDNQDLTKTPQPEQVVADGVMEYYLTISFSGDNYGPGPYKGQIDVYLLTEQEQDGETVQVQDGDDPKESIPFVIYTRKVDNIGAFWEAFKPKVTPLLKDVLEFVAVLLVIGIAISLINQATNTPGLSLDEITTPEDEKIGKQLSSLLQDEIDRFRGAGTDDYFSTTLVDQTQRESLTLSSTGTENTYAKIILDILDSFIKRNVIKVSGHTQRSSVKGVGITLSLTNNQSGRIIDTQTFWELDFSGTGELVADSGSKLFDPYLLLIGPAATWITFKVSEHLGKDYNPLGTTNWMSHAYYVSYKYMLGLLGYKNAPSDAKDRMLDLLAMALVYDQRNPAANIDSARFEYEEEQEDENKASIEKLKLIKNKLEIVKGNNYDLEFTDEPAPDNDAEQEKRKLKEPLIPGWMWDEAKKIPGEDSLPLLKKRNSKEPLGLEYSLWRTATFNLASVYALLAKTPEDGISYQAKAIDALALLWQTETWRNELKNRWLTDPFSGERNAKRTHSRNQYLPAIYCAIHLIELDSNPPVSEPAPNPPVPDPEFDIKLAEKTCDGNLANLSYRVNYDLACYYSKAAEYADTSDKEKFYEKGYFYLTLGMQLPGDLCDYAKEDSDLKNLVEHNEKKFLEIVNRHSKKPVVKTRALRDVLKLLAKQADINTPEELVREGGTRAKREGIANKTDGKLSYDEVTKWVRIADLMRINGVNGIGEEYATMLYNIKVMSPQMLATLKSQTLLKNLEDAKEKKIIDDRIPSIKILRKWIGIAKRMKDLVD